MFVVSVVYISPVASVVSGVCVVSVVSVASLVSVRLRMQQGGYSDGPADKDTHLHGVRYGILFVTGPSFVMGGAATFTPSLTCLTCL